MGAYFAAPKSIGTAKIRISSKDFQYRNEFLRAGWRPPSLCWNDPFPERVFGVGGDVFSPGLIKLKRHFGASYDLQEMFFFEDFAGVVEFLTPLYSRFQSDVQLFNCSSIMPEIVKILTDDQGRITHLLSEDEEFLSVEDLADKLDKGENYYVTFGDEEQYSITMVAEDGFLEPTVDDPSGERSLRDLPTEDDPAEEEIENMYDELENMGEFDVDDSGEVDDDENDELQQYS